MSRKKKIVALHFSHGLVQCVKKPWGLLFLLQLCSPSAAYLYLACLWAPIALHSGIQFTIISSLQKGSTLAVVQASWLPSMDIWKCAMKQPPVHMVSLKYSDFKWSPQWGQGALNKFILWPNNRRIFFSLIYFTIYFLGGLLLRIDLIFLNPPPKAQNSVPCNIIVNL